MQSEEIISWQSEKLAGLEHRLDQARNLGKHLFIWDKTGQVPSYFEDFGKHHEFTCEMV